MQQETAAAAANLFALQIKEVIQELNESAENDVRAGSFEGWSHVVIRVTKLAVTQ